MTGIITSLPPFTEQQPGNTASNPAGLPGVTYNYALLALPQTWGALQTFPQGTISIQGADINGAIPGVAPLASPALTGTPTAPTASLGTNTTQIATTAFVLANVAAPVSLAPQGRLTLTSGVPVTESDITGATTIYFTPNGGNEVPIYSGTAFVPTVFTELALALDATAAHTGYQQTANIFDLFVVNDSGTIRLGTGPGWAAGAVAGSLLARGTGAGSTELENFQGIAVNKNTMTLRFGSASGNTVSVPARKATYVGSFYATADGQATDSKLKRLLFNAYNATDRLLYMTAPANHTWSTNTFQPLANDPTNCFNILLGLSGTKVSAAAVNTTGNSTATIQTVTNAIGVDSTTSGTTGGLSKWCSISNAAFAPVECYYDGFPGLGFHSLYWLERGAGADTQTWYQTNSAMKGSVVL